MHYDFVDIGTCDFDTSADGLDDSNNLNILLIEPLTYYLNKLPDYPNVIKDNVGISNVHGYVKIYYLPESVIDHYGLPMWSKGCSSIGQKHPAIEGLLYDNELSFDLIKSEEIEIITFDMLCSKHNIESIGNLKIDTEGHEQYILPDILAKVKQGFQIDLLKFENQDYLGNKQLLDRLMFDFIYNGYQLVERTKMDVTLKKS